MRRHFNFKEVANLLLHTHRVLWAGKRHMLLAHQHPHIEISSRALFQQHPQMLGAMLRADS